MEIYERIKQRRKEIGLSAEKVAEKLGISAATMYRYENNDIKKFPIDILKPLADVLHTTPSYLMGWTDTPSNITLSAHEENVILAYRSHPDMQDAVDKLLNVDDLIASDMANIIMEASKKEIVIEKANKK